MEQPVTSSPPICFALVSFLLAAFSLRAQTTDEEFRVYRDHPRLFLTAARLRLLKRERDRQSPRWRQFEILAEGAAQMPEPGFSAALDYAISGNAGAGKRALDWALGPGADLRQLAIVFDWCQPLLTSDQARVLLAKIRRLLGESSMATGSVDSLRDRVLALIATADETQHGEEKPLRQVVEQWWHGQLAPALTSGHTALPLADVYALVEILHAIRDNLKIDLEDAAQDYFRELPKYQILGNYPAPLEVSGNEYLVPVYKEAGEPNLNRAALARAAGLSLVAYDNNLLENQYLQGWLMQDRFMLASAFGAPYEFLWANPYQPGLAYVQLPLLFHDQNSGALFVRSSWDDDALWFGLYDGEAQLFQDGHITVLNRAGPTPTRAKPIKLGAVDIVAGTSPVRFSLDGGAAIVVDLKPRRPYAIEIDDEELRLIHTDAAGTLIVENPAGRSAGVRIAEAEQRGE